MYNLKGFVSIDALANGDPSVVPAIGELSTQSQTYATGVGEYTSTAKPGYTLHAFKSATANGDAGVPTALQAQVFAIIDWVYTFQKSQAAATTPTGLTGALVAQFNGQATSIGCGNLISSGTNAFPEFISWVNPSIITNDPAVGGQVKIWLSDNSFQNQYDEYEIVVVPPVTNIDLFMSGATGVKNALSVHTYSDQINAIQTSRGKYPPTTVIARTFDYVDPTNASNRISTDWTLLIYGQSGNNIDKIKAAIQSYIVSNSQYAASNWRPIFPDLYTATEFYIIPRWSNIAIPGLTLQSGVYSSLVSPYKELQYVKGIFSAMGSAFIQDNLMLLPSNYKSLELLAIGDAGNQTTELNIATLFPDLINLPFTDTLFSMMSSNTRAWLTKLEQMILVAETATADTALPAGMSRAIRSNILFIVQEHNGINYLVSTKASTPAYQ